MRHPASASKARGPRKFPPQPTQLIGPGLVAPSSLTGTPAAQWSSPAQYIRQIDIGVLHAGQSSGWRRRAPAGAAPPHLPSPRGRHGRPGPGSSGGGALPSLESPGVRGGVLSSAGRPAGGAPLGLARVSVETPPRPMEVGLSPSLREPASGPSWLVGPGGGMVVRLMSRHRNPRPEVPPASSHGISSELSLPRGHQGWGSWKISACPK